MFSKGGDFCKKGGGGGANHCLNTKICELGACFLCFSCVLQSQPKVSGHPQKKALPRFPSFNVATMMSTFLWIFF